MSALLDALLDPDPNTVIAAADAWKEESPEARLQLEALREDPRSGMLGKCVQLGGDLRGWVREECTETTVGELQDACNQVRRFLWFAVEGDDRCNGAKHFVVVDRLATTGIASA